MVSAKEIWAGHHHLLRIIICIANLSKSKDNQYFTLSGNYKDMEHFCSMYSPSPEIYIVIVYFNSILLIFNYIHYFLMLIRITWILAYSLVLHSFLHLRPFIWVHIPSVWNMLFKTSIKENLPVANILFFFFCLKIFLFCPNSWKTFSGYVIPIPLTIVFTCPLPEMSSLRVTVTL